MRPETGKGLRAASSETRREILLLLCELMGAEEIVSTFGKCADEDFLPNVVSHMSAEMTVEAFVSGLSETDEDLDDNGQAILDYMIENFAPDPPPELTEQDAARLHDAICEDRRQDAIDIMNEITGYGFRSVREQANLFPSRVSETSISKGKSNS